MERAYQPCSDNPAGPTRTGDLCWPRYDQVPLSLGGQQTRLVQDSVTETWRAQGRSGRACRMSPAPQTRMPGLLGGDDD